MCFLSKFVMQDLFDKLKGNGYVCNKYNFMDKSN